MEWLINRRRMMLNRSTPPNYLTFEGQEIWSRLCCAFGDFEETAVTVNEDETVNITTSFVSMKNTLETKRIVLSTQTNVDNTGGTYVEGITKTPVGITMKQCAAVTDFRRSFYPVLTDTPLSGTEPFNEFKYFTGFNSWLNSSKIRTFTNGYSPNFLVTELTFPSEMLAIEIVGVASTVQKLVTNEGLITMKSGLRNTNCTLLDVASTVTTFSPYVLYQSPKRQICTVIMRPTTPPAIYHSYDGSGKPVAVYVPDESVEAYKADADWQQWFTEAGLDINTIIKPMSEYVES